MNLFLEELTHHCGPFVTYRAFLFSTRADLDTWCVEQSILDYVVYGNAKLGQFGVGNILLLKDRGFIRIDDVTSDL